MRPALDHTPPPWRWCCCPVVLLLGIATYVRLVQINTEEFRLVLTLNRLRRGYLTIAPGLEPTSPPATTMTNGVW
jgi:hypothetical protein